MNSTAAAAASPLGPVPHFTTPVFEGPLALLLHLIRANEVDIYDIPIAQITQQYLAYMAMMEELDLAIAGEYLVIAATLIEIKSRMLLPSAPEPEGEEPEDPRAELVARLVEYQQFQSAVDTLRGREDARRLLFFRGAASSTDDYILPISEGEANAGALLAALARLLANAGVEDKQATSVVPRKRLTLRLKMAEVLKRTAAAGARGLLFEMLFNLPCPRYDIILTFLALLELIRVGRVSVVQRSPMAPIKVIAAAAPGAMNE